MAQPKYPLRVLLKPLVSWFGRLGRQNAPSASFSSCPGRSTLYGTTSSSLHHEIRSDQEFWEMFFSPYIWAGLDKRGMSARLWTGAGPTYNEDGDQTSNAQIIAKDIDGHDVESIQLDACRWLLDQRIKKGHVVQLLKEIIYSKLLLKKSVHEILWVREENPEYGVKLAIDGFTHVDPTLFEFNPPGYEPGLYMQEVDGFGIKQSSYRKVDSRRFLVITNQELFSDKNGISELEPLRKAEPRREDAEKSWGRGAQRHGHGHIIGYYGTQLLGAAASVDRDSFQGMLKNMSSDTVSMAYEGNQITQLDVDVKSEVFKDLIAEFKAQAGLVLTGSTSTFLDEAGGTEARLESSEKAQKSDKEQLDCSEISAAITEQVLRRFCDYNWLETDIYPKMQIIAEEVIAPTLPETQETQTEILQGEKPEEKQEEREDVVKESQNFDTTGNFVFKLQEEEEQPYAPPVAIPPTYKDFPGTGQLPGDYQDIIEEATAYLEAMPVKPYEQVQREEGFQVFTIKRLRGFEGQESLLSDLKNAIIPTLEAKTEATAWELYWDSAIAIFQEHGFEQPSPELRSSLIISFRQARQNALNEGLYQAALQDDSVVGLRIMNNPDVKNHHFSHTLWHGVAIPKDHEELQLGGRLRIPMDMGCLCRYEKVYLGAELAPESEWPELYPGETYKYYAQPRSEA